MRPHLRRTISLLVAIPFLALPLQALAWNHKETHPVLNEMGAQLVQQYGPYYSEILTHLQDLKDGAINEDWPGGNEPPFTDENSLDHGDGSCKHRPTKHFFHPISHHGYKDAEDLADSCLNAVSWAFDDGGLGTWKGAVVEYGYGDKSEAYEHLGHVAHLLGDMSQPDHTHNNRHTFANFPIVGKLTGIEYWLADPDHRKLVLPDVNTLTTIKYDTMEEHLVTMAGITWRLSSIQATLDEDSKTATGDLTTMFQVKHAFGQWYMENYKDVDPGFQKELGNWDGNRGSDDDWWEATAETDCGPTCTKQLEGLYALREYVDAIPVQYKGLDGNWISNKTTKWNMARIYASQLLPLVIERIAGLYAHYYEVVNHPPILRFLSVTQGGCKYDGRWEGPAWVPVSDSNEPADDDPAFHYVRTLVDDCEDPVRRGWINRLDGPATFRLTFGAEEGEAPRSMKDVGVSIGGGGDAVQVPVSERPDGAWEGVFLPPADGSLDGHQTVHVAARDRTPHYSGPGRAHVGDELDADPTIPAALGIHAGASSSVDIYDWRGETYRPGEDASQAVMIDVTPPTIALSSAGVDGTNRTVAVYEAFDATSGVDHIAVTATSNAAVTIGLYAPGDPSVPVTITVTDRSVTAWATLKITDIAGNSYEPSFVLPVLAVKRGPETPPINPRSNGLTPVALLADDGFSPTIVDLDSLVFGPGHARPKLPGHKYDVDRDADRDLVLQFATDETAIGASDESACLSGRALDEGFIVTCQRIRIVGGGGQEMAWIDNPAPASLEVALTPEKLVSIAIQSAVVSSADPEAEVGPERGARILRSSDAVESHAVEIMSVELPPDGSASHHIDGSAMAGFTYWYWADVEGDGERAVRVGPAEIARPADSGVEVARASDVPRASHIASALPNPFRGEITFRYGLRTSGTVGMEIYNVHGRLVAHVVSDEAKTAGWHGATWSGHDRNGRAVPSGVYFARLTVGGDTVGRARRIILSR